MTGRVEMASIPAWKQNITESGRMFDDLSEPGGNSSDKYNNIDEIPIWRRGFLHQDSNNTKPRVRPSSTSSVDSRSSHVNNFPTTSTGGRVKFNLGDDTTEVDNMGEDRIDVFNPSTHVDVNSKVSIDNTHLKHVQSNPFFVELGGVTHPIGKLLDDSFPESPQLSRSDSVSTSTTEEEQNNYSPHSGIVEKLRKKFTSLSTHDNTLQGAASKLKRYGSLDNLLERGSFQETKNEKVKSSHQKNYVKGDNETCVSRNVHIDVDSRKNYVKPVMHKPPKIITKKTELVRKDSSSSVDEQKSPKPRVSDMQISTDDIIIIEQPPKSPESQKSKDDQEGLKSNSVKSLKKETEECELPKPNTVSTFLSIFEAKTPKGNVRKILPDAPRSPKFISASVPKPPVSRAKPQIPRLEKPTDSEKMVDSSEAHCSKKTEQIKTSQSQDITSTSDVPPVSSSDPATNISSDSISVNADIVSVHSSDNYSLKERKSIDKEPTTVLKDTKVTEDKEKFVSSVPVKPPRAFDSPVTKKKNMGEMKSIFDSNVIVATGPKPVPVQNLRTITPQVDVDKEKKTVQNGTSVQTRTNNSESSEQNEIRPVPDSTRISSDKTRSKGAAPVPIKRDLSHIQQKPTIPTDRTLLFDSSIIPVSSGTKTAQKTSEKMKAPPRPKAALRKARTESGKDETNTVKKEAEVDQVVRSLPIAKEKVQAPIPIQSSNEKSTVQLDSELNALGSNELGPTVQSSPVGADDKLNSQVQDENNKTSSSTNHITMPTSKGSNFEPVGILNQKNEIISSNSNRPTKGIPTIITNRFMKDRKDLSADTKNDRDDDSDDETTPALVKPSQYKAKKFVNGALSSPVPKKKGQSRNEETESVLDKTRNSVVAKKNDDGSQTNIDDLIRGKKSSPSAVFNSNMIPAKKPTNSSAVNNGVPPLDLSLIEQKKNHPYQEGYIPTKIEPCKIKFIGAGMKGSTSPMVKTKKTKLKISFNESPATHEYQSETAALHDYLIIHPTEEEEIKKEEEEAEKQVIKLEDFEYADESSDDVPETPRSAGPGDSSLRSNTSLSGSGSFGGYKSKMAVEFEFGQNMMEEPPVASPDPDTVDIPEEMDVLPAGDDDIYNWTENSSADLLF